MTTHQSPGPTATSRLPMRTILAYAGPGLMLSTAGLPLFVYLPKFYTDTLGASAAMIGLFIFAARLLDGISDPLIGWLSDRTRTRWGRRRPYLIWASPLLGLTLLALFAPPDLSPTHVGLWFGFLLLFLSVAWTMVNVPWEALGPELTPDYQARNRLFAWRDGFYILGILLAVILPLVLAWVLDMPPGAAREQHTFFWFALIVAPMLVLLCWLCAGVIQEQAWTDPQGFE